MTLQARGCSSLLLLSLSILFGCTAAQPAIEADGEPATGPPADAAPLVGLEPSGAAPDAPLLRSKPDVSLPRACGPGAFKPMATGTTQWLNGVWGSGPDEVFAVGDGGTILRFDGKQWTVMSSGTTAFLHGVWGSGPKNVFAVGDAGTVLRYDGNKWSGGAVVTGDLWSVWGSGPASVLIAGNEGVFQLEGAAWKQVSTAKNLRSLWGSSATDVFAVGEAGKIFHYDGATWSAMSSGTSKFLRAVHGSSSKEVLAGGYEGTLLRYDGKAWSAVKPGVIYGLRGIWAGTASDLYAVTDGGQILHGDGNGWSLWFEYTKLYLFLGVWAAGPDRVFAVGNKGTIMACGD